MMWWILPAMLVWMCGEASPARADDPAADPPIAIGDAPEAPPAPRARAGRPVRPLPPVPPDAERYRPLDEHDVFETDVAIEQPEEEGLDADRWVEQMRRAVARLGPNNPEAAKEIQELRRVRRRIPDDKLRGIVERMIQRGVADEQLSVAAKTATLLTTPQRAQAMALAVRDSEQALRHVRAALQKKATWAEFRSTFEEHWRDSGKDWPDLRAALGEALSREEVLDALREGEAGRVERRVQALHTEEQHERRMFHPALVAAGSVCAAYALLRGIARPARLGH